MINKFIYITATAATLIIVGCSSSTFEEIGEETIIEGPVTFNANVKAIIDENCVSCHNPTGVASFRPYTTYEDVRNAVLETNLLERIQLQNGDPDIMPQTGRMPQNKIDVILQWEQDGLLLE